MNKEHQKDEIILAVKEAFSDNAEPMPFVRAYIELDGNDIDHIAEQTAENLYNAGYRKTFTSDLASGTQKAFKEGYEKAQVDLEKLSDKYNAVVKKNAHLRLALSTAKHEAVRAFVNKLKATASKFEASQNGQIVAMDYSISEDKLNELIKEFEQ